MGVPFVRRSLWHEKGKLVLSVLGVAAVLTLIVLLNGFRDGMYRVLSAYTDSMQADLIVAQSGGHGSFVTSAIPAAIHDEIAAVSGAAEVEHVLAADIIFTYDDIKTPATLVGYNPENGVGGPWVLSEGRNVRTGNELTLDTWLARRAALSIGDSVSVLGRRFTIVGLTRETASFIGVYLFTSRNAAEALLQLPGMASFYWLRLPSGTDVEAVARTIETQVPGVEALTPEQIETARRKTLASVIGMPINIMLLISFITGIAVMGLITHTAIVDRTREYGVLKAVGASGFWLRRVVILATLSRTGLGFVLGVGLSSLAAQLIMRVFPQFTLIIRLETIGVVGLLALMMTVFAALLPVRRVITIDPAVVFKT